jgi:putative sigma-54 modulation protein
MNLTITFKQGISDDRLREHIEERSKTFQRYFQGNLSLTWTLSAEKQTRGAHCHLVGQRMDYFGEAEGETFLVAVHQVLDKLEKQVRKHKERVKNHLHQGTLAPVGAEELEEES